MKTKKLQNDLIVEGRHVKSCEIHYKLALSPNDVEILDQTPLVVPLNCEAPRTRNDLLKRFQVGSHNPSLYEEEEENFNELDEFFSMASEFVVDEETGLTALEVIQKAQAEQEAKKNELYQKHLEELNKSEPSSVPQPQDVEGSQEEQ